MSLLAPQLLMLEEALSAEDPRDGLKTALDVLADERLADEDARALVNAVVASLRRRVEEQEELRVVSERLEMLSHASFEGLFFHTEGEIVFANARVAELLGTTVEEFGAPNPMQRFTAPEDLPSVLERMASGYDGSYLITAVRADGSRFLAELQAKQGALGERPVRVIAVRDVTDRERQARLLRESEERLRVLAESAFDMIVISRDARVIDVGGAHAAVLGYRRDELLGRTLFDFVAPSAQAASQSAVAEERTRPFESVLVAKDGELVPVEIVAAYATFEGERARLAGLRDLRPAKRAEAERHRLRERMERGQRLESLGALAGGIAHDFNNLLVGIITNAELLGLDDLGEEGRESVDSIIAAGHRAADLTRQMLAYAGRGAAPVSSPVEIGELVLQLRSMLSARLGSNAELRLDIEPGCVVLGDRTTLSQVLMNLLTNASDALEDAPGVIDVRVRALRSPDARWDDALGAPVGPGSWIEVTVRDDGVGMDAATRARVFEPFFSTKHSGHGLGLAGCLGILRAHGGAVLVESALGEGSTFSVLLPANPGAADIAPSASEVGAGAPCKVLIVDDEPLVRDQLTRLLSLRGFDVATANSGEAALQRLSALAPELVILDFKMPGMTGLEVARRLRAQGEDVAILLSSGHLDADVEALVKEGVIQAFLAKPYNLSSLLAAIARARA